MAEEDACYLGLLTPLALPPLSLIAIFVFKADFRSIANLNSNIFIGHFMYNSQKIIIDILILEAS